MITKEANDMELRTTSADRDLLLELSGELDHPGARSALLEVEQAIDAALPRRLVMDLSGVTFMDSSGIALTCAPSSGCSCWTGACWYAMCRTRPGGCWMPPASAGW